MPETLAERIAKEQTYQLIATLHDLSGTSFDILEEQAILWRCQKSIQDFAREVAGQIRTEKSSVVSGPGTELLNQTREEDAELIEREGGVAK